LNTEQIRNIAIKQHDADADGFQAAYSDGGANIKNKTIFQYGRNMIIEELEIVLAELPKGSRILDVGCGTAHLTNWIQDKGFEVYGIEPSENMLAHARKNFPGIEIKKGVSSNIPYPGSYFDLVIAIEVLRYLDENDNIATLNEFNRVLKNGGDFFVTQVNLFSTDLYIVFHRLKGIWHKLRNRPHPYCNFTTYFHQQKLAADAGFTGVATIGRLAGSTRIFYKLGDAVGGFYKAIVEKLTKQKYTSAMKLFSGHLIVKGRKNILQIVTDI
jgi:ubiquinone/menaquinone biosynthesis C-methylase UbiE